MADREGCVDDTVENNASDAQNRERKMQIFAARSVRQIN